MHATYTTTFASAVAFRRVHKPLPLACQEFFKDVLLHLHVRGVSIDNLMMHDIALVEPDVFTKSDRQLGTELVWTSPQCLHPNRLLDHQAKVMDAYLHPGDSAFVTPSPLDLQTTPMLAGTSATLRLLTKQHTQEGILAVWVAAALFTAWQSRTVYPDSQGLSYNDVWNMVAQAGDTDDMIALQSWSPNSRQGLPDSDCLRTHHNTYSRGGNKKSCASIIGDIIAANARAYIPLRVHPVRQAPAAWIDDAITRRVDGIVKARAQEKARMALPETALEKAYRLLPKRQQQRVVPGSLCFDSIDAKTAADMRKQGFSIAAMAVVYDVTEQRMSKTLRAMHVA